MNLSHSEQMQKAIDHLPVHYREALLLCEVEEMSYQEIAEILSIPIGTVMSRLSRARQAVRESLSGKEITMEDYARREFVLGEYGGQLSSFEAVFSPRGADGRPLRLFNRIPAKLILRLPKPGRNMTLRVSCATAGASSHRNLTAKSISMSAPLTTTIG